MIYFLVFCGAILVLLAGYYIFFETKKSKAIQMGKTLEKDGKLDEAVAEYEKLLKNQKDEEVLWRIANLHEKVGKKNLAISRLKEIVSKKKLPANVTENDLLRKLAVLLYQTNRDEQAFEIFLKLYESDKSDFHILEYLAVIALGQRFCDIASVFLKKLIDLDDKQSNPYFLLGICYFENSDYLQAKKMFEKAAYLSEKDNWRIAFLEGVIYYLISSFPKSLECFEKTLDHQIEHPKLIESIYHLISRCHYKMNDYEKALNSLEEGKIIIEKLYPDYHSLALEEDIVAISIRNKDLQKAQSSLNVLFEKEPESVKWNTLFSLFEENNSSANSANSLNERLEDQPSFLDFLERWDNKDDLEDTVWELSNLSREASFDLNQYLNNEFSYSEKNQKELKTTNTSLDQSVQGDDDSNFDKKSFLDNSRKMLERLHFDIIQEKYNSDEVFLSQGDGIDYVAYLKGDHDHDKYIIQIRRWKSNSIGELVIKDLADQIKKEHAKKGIFITMGELSPEAMDFVEKSKNINIIQGKQLEHLLGDLVSIH